MSIDKANAQFINTGQSRTSIKWRIIKSEDFNIIYPDYFEQMAQQTANIFYGIFKHNNSLDQKAKKINFIIHPNGGISNGNVGWAPKRSELYTIPPQDAGESWLNHLCIHESRHVVQFNKMNQNTSKILYYIFGQMAPMTIVGLYVPMWFLEGDATSFETSAGQIGRGRDPEFLNEMKAQIIDKGIYSLSKATCGSYKDFVPDKYTMGYFMTANTRKNHGNKFWAKVLDNVSRHPFSFTPFSYGIKKNISQKRDSLWDSKEFHDLFNNPEIIKENNTSRDGKKMLYLDNFTELQKIWEKEKPINDIFTTIATQNKSFCNYYNPHKIMNSSLVMYKKGLDNSGAFILYNKGSEYTLTKTGLLFDYNFNVFENKIIWSEYQTNIRWEHEGKMLIAIYDINTKTYKRYKGINNRFSPFRTDSGWGCVETDNKGNSFIILYNKDFSKKLTEIKANFNEHFIHPSYYNGSIYTIIQSEKGNKISEINIKTQKRTTLLNNKKYQIDKPLFYNNNLYFRSSFNSNNSLYRINLKSKKINNILNSKYGIKYPSINNNNIYFSNYTSKGYKPCFINIAKLKENEVIQKEFTLAENISKLENFNNEINNNNNNSFTSQKYNKTLHLLNIHSWGPMVIDINDFEVSPGLTIYSQNKLNTLQFNAGYKIKNNKGRWFIKGSYLGLFPKFDFESEHSKETFYANIARQNIFTNKLDSLITTIKSSRLSSKFTIRVPLSGQYKNFSFYVEPYIRYTYETLYNSKFTSIEHYSHNILGITITPTDNSPYNIKINKINSSLLEYGLRINNFSQTCTREIYPKFGQYLKIANSKIYRKNIKDAYIFWTEGKLYFPGLFAHHSLSLYEGYQKMPINNIIFSNKINEPRGIDLYGYKLATFQANYTFPLCYPDLALLNSLYIKRIYLNVFYDTCKENTSFGKNNYNSYGLELNNNINLFKLTIPLTLGFRLGYEDKTNSFFFNLTFGYNISI